MRPFRRSFASASRRRRPFAATAATTALVMAATASLGALASAQPQPPTRERPLVPEAFDLAPEVREAIDAAWLTDAERRGLQVFHGQWTGSPPPESSLAARLAAERLDPDDPALADPAVPAWLRADVLRRIGRVEKALAIVVEAEAAAAAPGDDDDESAPATLRVHAEALADLGRHAEALAVLERLAGRAAAVLAEPEPRPEDLVELARGRHLAATLAGAPSNAWQDIVSLLSRVHQQIDRLHWPALVAEGDLLLEKHRGRAAMDAYHAALTLNPRAAGAWHGLGRLALRQFDFDGVARAASNLMALRPGHPLASLLLAEMRLVQDDPDGAAELLDAVLERHPGLRPAMALRTAAAALRYDADEMAAALAAWDAASPGAPLARTEAGRFLSTFRQYDAARPLLREAIEQLPAWGEPRLLLGLMEMQSGRDDLAAAVLREAARIDPFNARLANSLALIEELQDYARIETEHFVVRYRDGEDAVLASMMAEPLEAMHAEFVARFGTEPDRRTVIELMPDHPRFAVRITGMPRLFTIAACTGPVIAMEVPREGPRSRHLGTFDWLRVMRHEYAHTVTLAATDNRIPHWLTEGAAVTMENAPRAWADCLMLAHALDSGELFTLDEIKWGFVRPRTPQQRSLAYAQSQWMFEFMTERWGREAVGDLLSRYRRGLRESEAFPAALGVDRETFFRRFTAWAREQVAVWGLAPEPSLRTLVAARGERILREEPEPAAQGPGSTVDTMPVGEEDAAAGGTGGRGAGGAGDADRDAAGDGGPPPMTPPTRAVLEAELLAELLAEHPEHPDLLLADLERRLAAGEPVEGVLEADLLTYARIRPLDPFPHRVLAAARLAGDRPAEAIEHLEFLDAREQRNGAIARRLAELYRSEARLEDAERAVLRAIGFDPYHAPTRELAAAIAVEAGRLAAARQHVEALTRLEPDRELHARRLAAIDRMMQ
jgi:tetratricopeptide (TPR) repeat protein